VDTYRDETTLRADLEAATAGLPLTDQERRTLDWLAGWGIEAVGPIVSIIVKARADLAPLYDAALPADAPGAWIRAAIEWRGRHNMTAANTPPEV
jgi:hypothetical protein